jgi:hypothetical protein
MYLLELFVGLPGVISVATAATRASVKNVGGGAILVGDDVDDDEPGRWITIRLGCVRGDTSPLRESIGTN